MLKRFSRKSFLLFTISVITVAIVDAPLSATTSNSDYYSVQGASIVSARQELPEDNRTTQKLARGDDKSVLRTVGGTHWKAGLTAFRAGDMNKAANYFSSLLSQHTTLPSADRATLAFWAYRAYHAAGDDTSAAFYLNMAANEKPSFYNVLARNVAGREALPHDTQANMIVNAARDDLAVTSYPIPHWAPASGYKIDQALLFAIMRQESGFNPAAASPGGAMGVMQLMPATAHAMARTINLRGSIASPAVSMALGQQYIQRLMQEASIGNNLVFLLSAYNAGPVALERWQNTIAYNHDPLLFVESIPYSTTRDYVVNVIGNYWVYSELFGTKNPSLAMVAQGGWPLYAGAGVAKQVASARTTTGMN